MQSACAVLYCHLWPVWLYQICPHYLINGTIFWKAVIEHKMCVLILCTSLSETFLILRPIQRDIIINVHKYTRKVTLLMSEFNETLILWTGFRKVFKCHENSAEREPSCSIRTGRPTDRQTDTTTRSLFPQFGERT
jgi:hypothetical protein